MSRQQATKMKDVAEKAGVSAMTVSLVLRGGAARSRISEETRQRVLDAAKELSYHPNARGRSLRTGHTNVIGLYAGYGYVNVRLPFFTEIVSGLQEGCEQTKRDLLLHGVFHGTTPEDIYRELADGRIDGLVVTMPPDDPLAKQLADSHFPVVAIADSLPGIPSIVADDAAGSQMLARYLSEQGHRRVFYLMSPARPVSAIRRCDAFLAAAVGLDMEVEEHCLPNTPGEEADFLRELLSRDPSRRPSALACWNDDTAFHFCVACRSLGLRVPEDLAIVGFDGCHTPYETFWSLTTVRAPWAEVARAAVLSLDLMLKGESVPQVTVLPVEFIQGRTA